jgi:hypothetical protein
VRLGLFTPAQKEVKKKRMLTDGETLRIDPLGRAVPAMRTSDGLRATSKDCRIVPARARCNKAGQGARVTTGLACSWVMLEHH